MNLTSIRVQLAKYLVLQWFFLFILGLITLSMHGIGYSMTASFKGR